MKQETKVFVLNVDNSPFNSSDIKDWLLYQDIHSELTDDAEDFVTLCEEEGSVYSLFGFTDAINRDEINLFDCFVFISDCY